MNPNGHSHLTRREFVLAGAAAAAIAGSNRAAESATTARLASGVKVGETTHSTAVVWARVTRDRVPVTGPKVVGSVPKKGEPIDDPTKLDGACPGAAGRVRVRYGTRKDLSDAKATDWASVEAATDFTHQFPITDLPADSIIHYAVETADPGPEGASHGSLAGSFRTAAAPDRDADVRFAVVTCQMYRDLDDPAGFHIYPAIAALEPHFVCFSGDNVYYDNERPQAVTPALARYHWQRMYSLPRHVELLRSISSYWQKDDHDTCANDFWPGKKLGELTFEEGQKIFRQQVPLGKSIYRTFRWGRHVQVWLTDVRDFRSPNNLKDGPDKTILGQEQKAWLFRTLEGSDATWKVLVSPTPLVGPDRGDKNDNHANAGFAHEGDELRAWFKEHCSGNLFVVCGDRHWQYHSVYPKTGLHEFSVGAASDQHASGSPGEDKVYHRFHRVKGGFLTVAAGKTAIGFEHRDVHGKVVYRYEVKA